MNKDDIKIMIGVPTPGMSRRDEFYDYFHQLQQPGGSLAVFARGQSPARNRNLTIQAALDNNCSHILFLDDDIAFKPDLLLKLLAHDVDIVTGLQFMRNNPHRPLIFDLVDNRGACFHHYLSDNETGLIEVVACGLGCCLIKTDVFRIVEGPYWIRLGELDPDHWCDDLGFFKRVREKGFKIHCDLDTPVGHFANLTVWPELIDGVWHTSYDTNGDGRIASPQMKIVRETVGVN